MARAFRRKKNPKDRATPSRGGATPSSSSSRLRHRRAMRKTVSDDSRYTKPTDVRRSLTRTDVAGGASENPWSHMKAAPPKNAVNADEAVSALTEEPMTELGREITAARELQLQMLPSKPPNIPGYEATAFYAACDLLAGDFFYFVDPDAGHTGLLVADVSGHGLTAAMVMAAALKTFSFHARGELSPKNVMVNTYKDLESDLPKGRFITAFYLILNHTNGQIKYARAGHNPSLLCAGNNAPVVELTAPGLAIGLGGVDRFTSHMQEGEAQMDRGAALLLYSDGITEAHNSENEEYGERRLQHALSQTAGKRSRPLIEELIEDLQRFTETDFYEDDVTLLAIKRK